MVLSVPFMFLSLRDNKDQCHGDNAEKMKISSSSEPPESSSSLVSSTACHLHCNKVKEQVPLVLVFICKTALDIRKLMCKDILDPFCFCLKST